MRVLIVDDDATIRELLLLWLSDAGIRAEAVATVDEACRHFETFRPHAAIVDLSMPRHDGTVLAAWIKARASTCRVVMYSAKPDTEQFAKVAKSLGVDVWLDKMADGAAVIRAVRGEQS